MRDARPCIGGLGLGARRVPDATFGLVFRRVVLGGGITKSGERWWEVVRRTARAVALPQVRIDIVPAALGDDAPLWGAIALATA